MGLDQYIRTIDREFLKPVDFLNLVGDYIDSKEVGYWRNQRGVHNWMKKLYESKGGDDPDFNGNPVQLTVEDILAFMRSTVSTDWTDLDPRRDLNWVPEALANLSEGKTVYYTSSW